MLILGVIVGGVAAWLRQSKWRRTARKLDADVRALHEELETIRRRFGAEAPKPAAGRRPTCRAAGHPAAGSLNGAWLVPLCGGAEKAVEPAHHGFDRSKSAA